jgi:hypothetical protein
MHLTTGRSAICQRATSSASPRSLAMPVFLLDIETDTSFIRDDEGRWFRNVEDAENEAAEAVTAIIGMPSSTLRKPGRILRRNSTA